MDLPVRSARVRAVVLRRGAAALVLSAAAACATGSHAQGCTQCLDSTRATPPAVQAAYRHAIYLLGGVGSALFIGGAFLLRNQR